MTTINRWVGSILQFSQTVKSNPFSVSASNFLGLKQAIKSSPYLLKITQQFTMRTPVSLGRTSQLNVSNLFSLKNQAHRVLDVTAFNRINLYHFSRPVAYQNILHLLRLSQVVDSNFGQGSIDSLDFIQALEVTIVRNQQVTQTLSVRSGVIGYIPSDEFFAIPISIPGGPPGDDGRQ